MQLFDAMPEESTGGGRLGMERTEQISKKSAIKVLTERAMQASTLDTMKALLDAALQIKDMQPYPQDAPQRCVAVVTIGCWLVCKTCCQSWRLHEEPPECKGAPKPAEVPGCGSTCRWCGTGATNPAQATVSSPEEAREKAEPPKPRQCLRCGGTRKYRVFRDPGPPFDPRWVELDCRECQPVPDAPSAEPRAWVCVRSDKNTGHLLSDEFGNTFVDPKPLPSRVELGHIALEAWGNAHQAKTILETKEIVGRAIYRALGVSE